MNCTSLKTAKNLRINIAKNVIKNVKHCFILNGKELPIHYSTTTDVFRDVFVMFICANNTVITFINSITHGIVRFRQLRGRGGGAFWLGPRKQS